MEPAELEAVAGRYKLARMVYAAAELGIADVIDEQSLTAADVAEAIGALVVDPVERLLWALACENVFHEDSGRYSLTAVGRRLRRGDPDSAVAKVLGWNGLPLIYEAYERLGDHIREGKSSFEHAHGRGFYEQLALDPDAHSAYELAMAEKPETYVPFIEAHSFAGTELVVDVGGAAGGFLAVLLSRYPSMTGVLLDLPEVVTAASPLLEAYGVADRVQVVGGDMFAGMPGGGDLYVFSTVLRCFEDERCLDLLRSVRAASAGLGEVLAIEMVRPEKPGPGLSNLALDAWSIYGGTDRTVQHWQDLMTRAGFRFVNASQVMGPYWLLHAGPESS